MKYIVFLSILSGIFLVIYRHSDKKGFRRFWVSIKIAILIAATLAGLIPHNAEATDSTNPTQPVVRERVVETPIFKEDALNINQIRGGDLGKSGPGPRAKADASMNNRSPKAAKSKPGGSSFAEAWVQNPSNRAQPAAANRLAQQFQPGQAEGGNGLFGQPITANKEGRFSSWPNITDIIGQLPAIGDD